MVKNINVIVFGGTAGSCGSTILQRAIKEGLNVTAFVRTPSKVPDKLRKDLRVVKGDVLNEKDVVDAIKGQDVVLSAIGAGFKQVPTTLVADGCKNIVSGMKRHNVRKMVMMCAGVMLPGFWKPWILRHLVADYQNAIDFLKTQKSDIDWILLIPPFIRPSSRISQEYMVEKNDRTGRSIVTAGEVADFMMRVVQSDPVAVDMQHCLVGISDGPAYISMTSIKILTGVLFVALATSAAYYFGLISIDK